MTKNERIEALERRVAALEAVVQVKWSPPTVDIPAMWLGSAVCAFCGSFGPHTCVRYAAGMGTTA